MPALSFWAGVGVSLGRNEGCGSGRVFQRVRLISFESCHSVTVSHRTVAMLSYPWPFFKCEKREVGEWEWSWTIRVVGGEDYNQGSSRQVQSNHIIYYPDRSTLGSRRGAVHTYVWITGINWDYIRRISVWWL